MEYWFDPMLKYYDIYFVSLVPFVRFFEIEIIELESWHQLAIRNETIIFQ